MTNNLFVKFKKRAFKLKKVVAGFLFPDKIQHYFVDLCCKVSWNLRNKSDEYKF